MRGLPCQAPIGRIGNWRFGIFQIYLCRLPDAGWADGEYKIKHGHLVSVLISWSRSRICQMGECKIMMMMMISQHVEKGKVSPSTQKDKNSTSPQQLCPRSTGRPTVRVNKRVSRDKGIPDTMNQQIACRCPNAFMTETRKTVKRESRRA